MLLIRLLLKYQCRNNQAFETWVKNPANFSIFYLCRAISVAFCFLPLFIRTLGMDTPLP